MNELKNIYDTIITLWQLIKKHNGGLQTDAECEALVMEAQQIADGIQDKHLRGLFRGHGRSLYQLHG